MSVIQERILPACLRRRGVVATYRCLAGYSNHACKNS